MVKFSSRIPSIIAGLEAKASVVVRKTLADIEAGAKDKAPIDTGNLQNSIAGEMDGPLSGKVIAGADYAAYVELGTHKAAAQPFMVPSAEEARAPFKAALKQIVR